MIRNKERVFPFLEIPDKEWSAISSKFEHVECKKGSTLLEQGQIENHLYFVDEGIIRTFLYYKDRERTVRFAFPGNFVSSFSSFLQRKPSEIAIETLSDSKFWRISHQDLQECFKMSLEANRLGRIAVEQAYLLSNRREINI